MKIFSVIHKERIQNLFYPVRLKRQDCNKETIAFRIKRGKKAGIENYSSTISLLKLASSIFSSLK